MKNEVPQLLFADKQGKIYNFPDLETAGMKAGRFFRLRSRNLVKLPSGSSLFMLPQRAPVGYDLASKRFVILDANPFSRKNQVCFAVCAFVSPGSTVTFNCAYHEIKQSAMLPLFAYAAVTLYKGEFYVASVRTDRELRQDARFMNLDLIKTNAAKLKKEFFRNRLIRHLENCALVNCCPAARNFFLSRYEAPLPTSPACNADCFGCISYQPNKRCPITQPRIKFVPTPEEIQEVALIHIRNVKDPVISFGQGCEGEPLLVGGVIEKAIRLVRRKTAKGIININTNASKPKVVARLFDAGLDSIRVSLNSVQKKYYTAYHKPRGYDFADVLSSINAAKKRGGFVSLNYLTMPGFTDTQDEFMAFESFIQQHQVDMVQWRNLNIDPLKYFKELKLSAEKCEMIGVKEVICSLRKNFPNLMMGYFNPSKQRIKRHCSR